MMGFSMERHTIGLKGSRYFLNFPDYYAGYFPAGWRENNLLRQEKVSAASVTSTLRDAQGGCPPAADAVLRAAIGSAAKPPRRLCLCRRRRQRHSHAGASHPRDLATAAPLRYVALVGST